MKPLANTGFVIICPLQVTNPLATTVPNINLSFLSTWHSIGHNWSGKPRKTIFMGYAYRWVKPMDYISMPDELVAKCTTPIQKQLLGVVGDSLSYYLPKDEDVSLKALFNQT